MKGHFTSHYLAEVLRDIFLQETSGILALESSSGPAMRLDFDRGMLAGGDAPTGATTLAAALRDEGLVPANVLLDAVPDCTTAQDLASCLLDRAAATPQSIGSGMKGLIRRLLAEAFTWTGGTYTFEEKRLGPTGFTPDVLFTFESILVGISSMSNFDPLQEVLVALPGRLRISQNLFLPVDRLALKPHHGFFLSRIDGTLTMNELAQVVPDDAQQDALKFSYGLLVLGVAVFDPPLAAGPFRLRDVIPGHHEARARAQGEEAWIREHLKLMAGQSPSEILGVPEGADTSALRAAFAGKRALLRRERFCEQVREGMKREIDLLDAKLTEAFFGLELGALEKENRAAREGGVVTQLQEGDLYKRREFYKTEAQTAQEENVRLADKYYAKARDYFRETDYYNCIQFCRQAIKFNAESAPAYRLMAEALSHNPDRRWQRQAEEAYLKATELDSFNVEYFVALGTFYKDRGLDIRARKMFEKALEILPSHEGAARELKLLRR